MPDPYTVLTWLVRSVIGARRGRGEARLARLVKLRELPPRRQHPIEILARVVSALCEHPRYAASVADVLQGVPVEKNQVRDLSGFDRPHLAGPAQQASRRESGRLQSLSG